MSLKKEDIEELIKMANEAIEKTQELLVECPLESLPEVAFVLTKQVTIKNSYESLLGAFNES